MARSNRVSVPNGTYHVTTRIVNRERWLADGGFKDEIVSWLYGVAEFSGVELLAWCVMDNHLHLLVHVPTIPAEYRLDPSAAPASHAFGMRPPECNAPLWCRPGDRPRPAARPETGFALPDDELRRRLVALLGSRAASAHLRRWERMRAEGASGAAAAEIDRHCRRMYNLSQFVKTLKERIARGVKARRPHVGHVFEGRFHSGLVEDAARELVSLYIDYNPRKAGLVEDGGNSRWSSFGVACGDGPRAAACRAAYERLYHRPWEAVRERILSAFHARLPYGEDVERRLERGEITLTPAQLVKLRVPALSRGAYVARSVAFGHDVVRRLGRGFPCPSPRSLAWLVARVRWAAA